LLDCSEFGNFVTTLKTDKISQQPENCENSNDLDLVQAFLKKWWVESYLSAKHVWDELGHRVYRNNRPQTFQELRNRLMLEWQNMPQDVIRRCVDSMRKRCQAGVIVLENGVWANLLQKR
jgi:hypothetical protein